MSKYWRNFSRSAHSNTEVTPLFSYTSSRTDVAHKHNSQFTKSKFALNFVEGFSVKTKRMFTNLHFVNDLLWEIVNMFYGNYLPSMQSQSDS